MGNLVGSIMRPRKNLMEIGLGRSILSGERNKILESIHVKNNRWICMNIIDGLFISEQFEKKQGLGYRKEGKV